MSLFAGVVGMGLGGMLTAIVGSRTDRMISVFLSFAGGVMMSIVFFELIPEAIAFSNIGVAIAGLIFGAIMVMALNNIMDKISKTSKFKLHENYAEYFHSSDIIGHKKSLLRSGLIMLFVIALHNIPEGLAMGAAGYHDSALGLTLAIMIGLHNIPEGMAISAPLISGGFLKSRTIILVSLTGATTVIGAVTGVIIGGISDMSLALSFSMAGGAMLYVVQGEILPQSIVTNKDRVPTVFVFIGIIVGLLFTQI
jgi:ZIP family zinc transporter